MNLLPNQFTEERPWGYYERFTLNEVSTVKILRLKAGMRISLQRHHRRNEYWKIIEGEGKAHIGDKEFPVTVGDEILIPIMTLHRLTAGDKGIACLEISIGDFDETDNERVEDDYGRVAE